MKIGKKNIAQVVVALYVILSLGFILFTFYNNFKVNIIQKSYSKGQEDGRILTIQQLIQQAEDPTCKEIPVFMGEKKVTLQNINCKKEIVSTQNGKNTDSEKEQNEQETDGQ